MWTQSLFVNVMAVIGMVYTGLVLLLITVVVVLGIADCCDEPDEVPVRVCPIGSELFHVQRMYGSECTTLTCPHYRLRMHRVH